MENYKYKIKNVNIYFEDIKEEKLNVCYEFIKENITVMLCFLFANLNLNMINIHFQSAKQLLCY